MRAGKEGKVPASGQLAAPRGLPCSGLVEPDFMELVASGVIVAVVQRHGLPEPLAAGFVCRLMPVVPLHEIAKVRAGVRGGWQGGKQGNLQFTELPVQWWKVGACLGNAVGIIRVGNIPGVCRHGAAGHQ